MTVQKRGKPKAGIWVFLLALLFIAGVAGAQWLPPRLAAVHSPQSGQTRKAETTLYSENAILMRLSDRNILLEKQADERIFPASLTKMMTVLVAIEHLDNLRKPVVMQKEWYDELLAAGASMAGFLPGEQVTVKDLLYGSLLASGAECCAALAVTACGSQSAFVNEMNRKAKQLGMKHTHFTNPTGLHHDEHYSTVRDFSRLLCEALQNKTFRELFTSKRFVIQSTNRHPQGITLNSSLFSKISSSSVQGGQILGGKTGYTEKAGLCLATLSVIDGNEYILITAGAPGDHKSEQYHVLDAFTVYNTCVKP